MNLKPNNAINLNLSTMRFSIQILLTALVFGMALPSSGQTLAGYLAADCDAFTDGTFTNFNAFGLSCLLYTSDAADE